MYDQIRVSHAVTAALLALTLTPAVLPGQNTYDCGNLNQRACTSNDFEYSNMVAGESRKCEVDLTNVDGYCRNNKRITPSSLNPQWYKWALSDQSHGIGRDTPINFITWPGSHNAYSTEASGFGSGNYTNHRVSITDQLNLGARHLELDPKFYFMTLGPFTPVPISDQAIRLCHASFVGLCTLPGYQSRLFGFALTEIATWLDANPGQVVYIKIDNINLGGAITMVHDEIARYLGHRVFKAPNPQPALWPTIGQIRAAGKSIIVVQHNANSPEIPSEWMWSAVGRLQTNNHPKNQNFDTCVAYDGRNPTDRGLFAPATWWDTAEGRTKLNDGDKATGLYWEDTVVKAANCGVAVIGLDFIDGLYSSYNISPTNNADNRLKHVVWSWSEGDWGNRGPAYQDPTGGRWVSFNASASLPLACAIKNPGARQDRGWKVTSASIPWNKPLGDLKCAEEFGSNYEFSFPANGWQNQDLKREAAGRKPWLAYNRVPTANVSASTTSLVFRMDPNGTLPQPQSIRLSAAPGTTAVFKQTGNLPITFNLPTNALSTGEYNLAIGIGNGALSFTPGLYTSNLDVTFYAPGYGPGSANPVFQNMVFKVDLYVRANAVVSAYADPTSARQGTPVNLIARFTAGKAPTGGIKFYRIRDANGASTGQETVAAGTVSGIDGVKIAVSNLPLGTNIYVASYAGDGDNMPATSEPFTFTATPRIVANPASVLITRQTGAPAPALQNVALTGLGTGASILYNCSWLKAALSGSTIAVGLGDSALSFAVGSYPCNITVQDSLTQQGQSYTIVPVEYRVQASLSASPNQLSLSSFSAQQANIQLQATGGTAVPISVSTDRPWILTELNATQTPATLTVVVDPQSLPVGTSTGSIMVQSNLAAPITIPVTFNKAGTTTIDSTPSGRTVLVDGVPVTTPATFTWQPNTSHTLSADTQIIDGVRYKPVLWQSGASATLGTTLTVQAQAAGAAYSAGFELAYRLTTTAIPSGSGGVVPNPYIPDGFYAPGTSIQINAITPTTWTFTGWTGDLTGTEPRQTLVMSGPRSVIGNFSEQKPIAARIVSNAPGATVAVNGTTYTLPVNLLWTPGMLIRITPPAVVPESAGARWAFANFSSSQPINGDTLIVPQNDVDVRLNYNRQFLLTAAASPNTGGTVTGAGWYNEGATATVQAIANSGFSFVSFTGDFTSTTNPLSIPMTAARNVAANFNLSGRPTVTAAVLVRSEGPGTNQRTVPIQLRNTGTAPAQSVVITGITGITVLSGSGPVSLATPAPLNYGDIGTGAVATQNVVFNWPATAIRVTFTVNFAMANGQPGSTTFTLFR